MNLIFYLLFSNLFGCGNVETVPTAPKPKDTPQAAPVADDPCGAEFTRFRKDIASYTQTAEKAAKGNAQALTRTQSMLMQIKRNEYKITKLKKDGKLNRECEREFTKLQKAMGRAVAMVTKAPPSQSLAPGKKGKGKEKEMTCDEKCKAMKAGPMSKLACQNKCDAEKRAKKE